MTVEVTNPTTEPAAPPVEEPKTDPSPTTENPESPKPDDKFAPKFAALSRREKEARMLKKEAEGAMNEVHAYRKEVEDAKKDPLGFLERKFGVTFDDLTAKRLEKGPINKDSEEIKELRETVKSLLDERSKEKQMAESSRMESVISGFKGEITKSIEENKDKYPLLYAQNGESPISGVNGTDLAYDIIDHHYSTTGAVISAEKAFEVIEKHLEKSIESILGLSKVQELIKKLSKPSESQKTQSSESKQTSENKTLKNSYSATNPQRVSNGRLNDAEDLKRATEILRSRMGA